MLLLGLARRTLSPMGGTAILPIFFLAIGIAMVAWVSGRWVLWWAKRRDTLSRIARAQHAQHAETQAELLAERLGYTIVGRQVRNNYTLTIGDDAFKVELRVDLLLQKDDQLFLAEVKSGAKAPDIQHAPTRRQLLEYAYAFNVTEILLFDMSTQSVRSIRFPVEDVSPDPSPTTPTVPPIPPPPEAPAGLLLAGIILGLGAATIQPVDVWLHRLSDFLAQSLSP